MSNNATKTFNILGHIIAAAATYLYLRESIKSDSDFYLIHDDKNKPFAIGESVGMFSPKDNIMLLDSTAIEKFSALEKKLKSKELLPVAEDVFQEQIASFAKEQQKLLNK